MYAVDIWQALRGLGGIGLILLGLTDGSLIPLLGSMDALTIMLASRHHDMWLYYAGMATIGSTIGGSLTYRLASRRGNQLLIRRFGELRTQRLCRFFTRWGFGAVAVPALLPPPFPIVPFLLAAGATHYPRARFVAALASGRAVKFTLLAFLASLYGRRALRQAAGYYTSLLLFLLMAAAMVGVSLLLYRLYNRRIARPKNAGSGQNAVVEAPVLE
jgi:membrane protein YqaA with SNARE-associated domain